MRTRKYAEPRDRSRIIVDTVSAKLYSYPLESPRAHVTSCIDGTYRVDIWDTDEENVVLSVQGHTEGHAKANYYRRLAEIIEQKESDFSDDLGED